MAIAPALLGVIGTVATVAQVGLGVAGSFIGAASEAEAARQAEETALKNKQIAAENANRSLLIAQEEQYDSDVETAQLIGEQEAIQAGSGLRLDSGSFIQTRRAARELGRIDALNIREAGEIRAQAYRNEGDAYAADAAASRLAGQNANLRGFLGAASSIVGGAGRLTTPAANRNSSYMSVPSASLLA